LRTLLTRMRTASTLMPPSRCAVCAPVVPHIPLTSHITALPISLPYLSPLSLSPSLSLSSYLGPRPLAPSLSQPPPPTHHSPPPGFPCSERRADRLVCGQGHICHQQADAESAAVVFFSNQVHDAVSLAGKLSHADHSRITSAPPFFLLLPSPAL
jgi:hypothetical protein